MAQPARRTYRLVSTILLPLASLALACGERRAETAGADSPARGGTVVVAGSNDLDNLNSLASQERYTQELLRFALFLPLVSWTAQLDYQPALARSWEMTGDTGVAFQLREDVRWHDGMRTTAYDVAFTFERAKDPATAFPQSDLFLHWTGVEVVDSFRVRFRFEPHADPMAGLPFVTIMPRHLLDTIPPALLRNAPFNKQPVGNGPFRFVDYRPNDRWVFEANPDYPEDLGGRPYIDRLIWRVIPDNTAQVTELQTGNADLILNTRPEQVARLDSAPDLRAVERESRQYAFVGWNGRRPPLDQPAVRRALTMALNRQRMIDVLRNGRGSVAVGPVGRYHWAFADTLRPLPFDADAAKQLLAGSGISDRNGDGTLDRPDGRPFAIELKLPANSPFNRDMAELIASDLGAIGVRVEQRPVEFNALIGEITGPARSFDAVLMGWESDFRLNLRNLFHSAALPGPFQIAGYANPEVDRIIDETATLVAREAARSRLERLQVVLRDEQPWSFLYYWPDVYVVRERLRGVEMDIRGAFVSLPRWWVGEATTAAR
jgi:peptide/nickel transport system substrate-binding protein